MLETIIILLILIFLEGAWILAIADDIKTAQQQVAAALTAIAAQKASMISPADAQAILTNEQANLAQAQTIVQQ